MRLNPKAFGIAAGAVAGGGVFVGTLVALMWVGDVPAPPILRGSLFGYEVSPAGAFIGAMWAYVYGFLGGAGFAFIYNLAASPSEPPALD
jgi:hypothetical protein